MNWPALLLAAVSVLQPAQGQTREVGTAEQVAGVRQLRRGLPAEVVARWSGLAEGRPALRGFRADPLRAELGPLELPDAAREPELARAAELVARELAREGLPATLARAVEALGSARADGAEGQALLRRAGLPVDLLACFTAPDGGELHAWVVAQLASGRTAQELAPELRACAFAFPATVPLWRAATESGEHEPAALRLQLSSSSDYAEPGQGGALDIVRSVARLLPGLRQVVSVEERHLGGLIDLLRALPAAERPPVDVLVEPLPVAQWAQDNAKPGLVAGDGGERAVLLAPRYASRGEDGSAFVPGETLLLGSLPLAGLEVALSPLLFQGGNLLVVRDPRDGLHQLVMGEAELARNTALGLTREQVLAAFRVEFGVDRCVVLPAVSFHIDTELSVRAGAGGLTAFVCDTTHATRLVLGAGIGALERGGVLSADDARSARGQLERSDVTTFVNGIGALLADKGGPHRLPGESFARHFAAGPADSGVGNLQRFLLAIDGFAAEQFQPSHVEEIDPHAAAYLESFRQRERERIAVAQALQGLGWKVVAVPSTSEGSRSLNAINGVHLRGRYLMPVYGGLYADFDRAAREAIVSGLDPDVAVIELPTGETQRRAGALHCVLSVIPAPAGR